MKVKDIKEFISRHKLPDDADVWLNLKGNTVVEASSLFVLDDPSGDESILIVAPEVFRKEKTPNQS